MSRRSAGSAGSERDRLLRRCAWCGRVEIEGEFVDAASLVGEAREHLRRRATDGICPQCLAREQRAAGAARQSAAGSRP